MTNAQPLRERFKHSQFNSGQALIETLVSFLLASSALTIIFIGISTGTEIFIWHQKVNQSLLCSLNQKIVSDCLKDFNPNNKIASARRSNLIIRKFNFRRLDGIPRIELELVGYFNEVYKINKSLDKKVWRI